MLLWYWPQRVTSCHCPWQGDSMLLAQATPTTSLNHHPRAPPPHPAGFLLQKELDYLDGAVTEPKRPFVAIVGGSKVSSKITVIESLLSKVDKLIIGGGMIFTFYKARGLAVGSSLVEEEQLELAKKLEVVAKEKGVQLLLPTDVIVADKFDPEANTQTVDVRWGTRPDA